MPEVLTDSVTNLFEYLSHSPVLGLSDKDRRVECYEVEAQLKEALQNGQILEGTFELLNGNVEQIKANTQNVVMVVHKRHLLSSAGSDKVLIWSKPLPERKISRNRRICPSVLYASQASAFANGTGFFLNKEVVATAAHVLINADYDMRNYRFIKGVVRKGSTDFAEHLVVHKSQVWKSAQNKKRLTNDMHELYASGADWALFKVKPAFNDYPPSVEQSNSIIDFVARDFTVGNEPKRTPVIGDQLYALGHGFGLTTKLSFNGEVFRTDVNGFECDLTLLGGNSGSPVFFADDHTLAGLYVRGVKKMLISQQNPNCLIVQQERQFFEGQECQILGKLGEALNVLYA